MLTENRIKKIYDCKVSNYKKMLLENTSSHELEIYKEWLETLANILEIDYKKLLEDIDAK